MTYLINMTNGYPLRPNYCSDDNNYIIEEPNIPINTKPALVKYI